MQRLIYPHSVRRTRFGSEPYDLDLMKAIWSNLLVVMIVITGASALLAITQPSYEGALLAAVSSFSNIGPLYSPEWPGATNWPAFADFDGFSKAVCVITMILGRVEVIAVLGAFNLAYWRN